MVRFSHIAVSIINILVLLWSIIIISAYLPHIKEDPDECNGPYPMLMFLYGVFLFLLSLVALIGAIRGNRRLLSVYVGVLFVWFFWLIGSSAFLLVLNKATDATAVNDPKEYKLNEYPEWLRRYVVDGDRWVPIKKCIVRNPICKLSQKEMAKKRNLRIELSSRLGYRSLAYGCCQPPLQCGFVSKNGTKNGTSWEVPKSGIPFGDSDCQSWRNNLDQLCYDCNSCKAGYLRTIKGWWVVEASLDALKSALIFVGFWIAFWAFRQAPREDQLRGNIASVA